MSLILLEVEDENEVVRRPVGPRLEGGAQVRRVGGRVVRSRLHRARQQQQQHREEEENELEELEEDEAEAQEEEYETSNTILDAKIGAKKRKKLEMKAERRAQREVIET